MLYRLSVRFRTDATGRRVPDDDAPGIDEAARHYRARDYAAAARACEVILVRQPRHFDALHLRGVVHMDNGQAEESLACLRLAAQVQPNNPLLQFNIGNALLALKRHDEAVAAFRSSLSLRPGDADTLNNLGNALSGGLRHAEAIACFREALSLRPAAPQVLYNLGRSPGVRWRSPHWRRCWGFPGWISMPCKRRCPRGTRRGLSHIRG
jgi:Tfp pilus assembly protein PilF